MGRSILDRVVRERSQAAGFKDLQDYATHLQNTPSAILELIDATVVPETWFCRDLQIFDSLAAEVRRVVRSGKRGKASRLLSLPCSTGEEPYSIAMCLLGAGFESDGAMIEGVDVCRRSIALAQRGIYGRNSFRGEETGFRERFFAPEGTRYQIRDAVRSMVRFRCGNILAAELASELGAFDVVFCRNVLIYFDLASRDLAFGTLSRLVREGGLLIVTPAEAPLVSGWGFEAADGLPISCFRRVAPGAKIKTPAAPPGFPRAFNALGSTNARAPMPRSMPFSGAPLAYPPAAAPQKPTNPTPSGLLEQAAQFADDGKLDEAERICHEFLKSHAPQAEVYYLMGLVCDARGKQVEAGSFYRKTLYLSPTHYEALVHLSAVLEIRGEKAEALLMRQRAIRIQGK